MTTTTALLQSNDLQYRIEELKQSLAVWRNVLVPLNNLLEWEQKYDPLIIFGSLTSIFLLLRELNPPILTLLTCLMLISVLIDLLGMTGLGIGCKNKEEMIINDLKYSRLCERIAYIEQALKYRFQSARQMRQERPIMYRLVGVIVLLFLAICSQRIDNLLLSYLIALAVGLLPGVYHRQLIACTRQMISDFWNKTKMQ